MSMHLEDWPQVTTFTYRMRGMSNRTTHHYLRAYQMELWKRVSKAYFARTDDFCIGAQKRHERVLRLVEEFRAAYGLRRPTIAIAHYIENSHDGNARVAHMDKQLRDFLARNTFDNTLVVLYSDHGARF